MSRAESARSAWGRAFGAKKTTPTTTAMASTAPGTWVKSTKPTHHRIAHQKFGCGGRAGSVFWNGLGFLTTVIAIVLALVPPADTTDKLSFFLQVFIGSFGFLFAGLILAPAWTSYSRLWERLAASVLSLYVLALLVGLGVAGALAVVYFWG